MGIIRGLPGHRGWSMLILYFIVVQIVRSPPIIIINLLFSTAISISIFTLKNGNIFQVNNYCTSLVTVYF